MDTAELSLYIASTKAFILADAEDFNFLRSTKVSDGAGGFILSDPEIVAIQMARIIPQNDKTLEVVGADGRSANPQWIILMLPGADIARYDRFIWRGKTWEIAEVHDKPDYEIKGDVIRVN